MSTVIERGVGGPICGECNTPLPVVGDFERLCLKCSPEKAFTYLDEREQAALKVMMVVADVSPEAVMRQSLRMYQLFRSYLVQGYHLAFLNPATGEYETPLNRMDAKYQPMP